MIHNHEDTDKDTRMKAVKRVILGIYFLGMCMFFAPVVFASDSPAPPSGRPPAAAGLEEQNNSPRYLWLMGEIALAVITAVILLIIYNRHLRAVVADKTRELQEVNAQLEDKVRVRTAELRQSTEAYKEMSIHAQAEEMRAKIALKSEREAIEQNLNFLDMISHEYRTPLSVISSSVELIEKKCERLSLRDLDEQIRKMKLSVQRLIDIFESCLGKDRMDQLTPQFKMGQVNLGQILDSAVALVNSDLGAHQILYDKNAGCSIRLTGDEKLLITVFKNILENACKYSLPDTPVYMEVTAGRDGVEVCVIDSGIGIDDDETAFVFEKYFRSERTGKKQGVGLGLFLVKSIVKLHQGRVKLESRRNTGTKVFVWLPRAQEVSG